jgi:hypothetical protein
LISPLNQKRVTANCVTGGNIAPAIADHKTPLKRNIQPRGGPLEQSGFWFSAFAPSILAVWANFYRIGGEYRSQPVVHGLDNRSIDEVIPDVWLVGNDDDEVARLPQRTNRILYAGKQSELCQCSRSVGFAVADNATVHNPVSIEKYRPHCATAIS